MPSWARYFNKFYSHGMRFLKISAGDVDELLAAGAIAEYESGVVTITEPGGPRQYYPVNKHLHRRDISAWVTEFNKRSASPL